MPGEDKTKDHDTAIEPTQPECVSDVMDALKRYRAGISLLDTTYVPRNDLGMTLATSIRAGLAPRIWAELRGIGFSTPELASVIGVSEKTVSRKQNGRERLDIVEGDRTLRLAQITLEAAQAFGALDKALRWLRKPNRVLGAEKPLDLIATEPGAALVRRALGTIEYGGVA